MVFNHVDQAAVEEEDVDERQLGTRRRDIVTQ